MLNDRVEIKLLTYTVRYDIIETEKQNKEDLRTDPARVSLL